MSNSGRKEGRKSEERREEGRNRYEALHEEPRKDFHEGLYEVVLKAKFTRTTACVEQGENFWQNGPWSANVRGHRALIETPVCWCSERPRSTELLPVLCRWEVPNYIWLLSTQTGLVRIEMCCSVKYTPVRAIVWEKRHSPLTIFAWITCWKDNIWGIFLEVILPVL